MTEAAKRRGLPNELQQFRNGHSMASLDILASEPQERKKTENAVQEEIKKK